MFEEELARHPPLLGRVMALTGEFNEQAIPATVILFEGVGRQMVTGVGGDKATKQPQVAGITQHLLNLPSRGPREE